MALCTCAGTAPGYPQHEDYCRTSETDCVCGYNHISERCEEHAWLLVIPEDEPIPFILDGAA